MFESNSMCGHQRVLRRFLLPRWTGHWPRLAARTQQGGVRSVEPFRYKLLPWSWLKLHWRADWLQWRSLLMCCLIFLPFQWGNEYWIAAAQWMVVIAAGAVPCTPAPHTPPLRPMHRVAPLTHNSVCPMYIHRHSSFSVVFSRLDFFQ